MSFLKTLSSHLPVRRLVESAVDKTGDAAKAVAKTTKKVANSVEDTFESAAEGVEKFVGKSVEKTKFAFEGAADAIESALGKVDSAFSGRVVHGPMKKVPHEQLKLKADFRGLEQVKALEASGGFKPVSLADLPLDRTYVAGSDRGPNDVLPSTGMKEQTPVGFKFNAEDQASKTWYPQAVTTSADADGTTGTIDGKKWVGVTWYSKDEPRSRISFVDHTAPGDPSSQKYRHVELMVPDAKTGKLEPLESHVGGVTWSGNYLYVAQTSGGVRVFDTRHLLEVKDAEPGARGHREVRAAAGGLLQGAGGARREVARGRGLLAAVLRPLARPHR